MSTVPAPQPQSHVTVTAPSTQATWQAVFAAIMAAFHAAAPIIVHIVPPPVATGLELTDALAPIVVQTVIATQAQQQQ